MGTRNNSTVIEWILVAISAVAVFLMGRAVVTQGISYDSAFDMEAYNTISNSEMPATLEQAYDVAPITSEFYGLFTFQIAEFLGRPWGVSIDPDELVSYQLHHGFIAILAILGAMAVGAAAGLALKSRIAGLFTTALVLVTPLWMGLGVMDYKDVPIAAGLSMITLALTITLTKQTPSWLAAAIAAGIVGTTVAMGTRAGSVALVLALLGITVGVQLIRSLVLRSWRPTGQTLVVAMAGLVGGALWLLATNPFAQRGIVRWLRDAVDISQSYIWIGQVRTAGQDLTSNELPWWYVPSWLGAQLPLVTSIICALGIVLLLVGLRNPPQVDAIPNRGSWVNLTPILSQGLVLPLLVIASGAVLYDGIRHLLFALPAFLSLSSVVVAWAYSSSGMSQGRVMARNAAVAVAGLSIVLSLFAAVRWFPYTYAYINPVAGWDKSERNWELDYWGLTTREGVARLRDQQIDPVAVAPAPETGRPFDVLGPAEGDAYTAATGQARGVYVFRRWDAVFRQDWCTRTFTIERDGLILGEGGTCP